jgi:peptide/nickel transport system substrate-binding protein
MTPIASTTPSPNGWQQRLKRWWPWIAVGVLVLVLPIASIFRGGLGLPSAPKPTVALKAGQPVGDGTPYLGEDVLTMKFGRGAREIATIPSSERYMPTGLEVIAPAPDGRVWVVDHPVGTRPRARVRLFSGGSLRSTFYTPQGGTLFTPGRRGDLWVDFSMGASGSRETVRRYASSGRLLGQYLLPEGVLARSLQVTASDELWVQVEEWRIDPDTERALLISTLVPVAGGSELLPVQDPLKKTIQGSFLGGKGTAYRVLATLEKGTEGGVFPESTVRAETSSGVVTFKVPYRFRPFAADDLGRVYAYPVDAPSDAQGKAIMGDAAGSETEMLVYAPSGRLFARLPIDRPTYVNQFAPAAWPDPSGRLLATVWGSDGVRAVRLSAGTRSSRTASAPLVVPDVSVVSPSEPLSGDPYRALDAVQRDLFQAVYSGLVRLDGDLNPVADLAEAVPIGGDGVSADGLTIKYRLRPGATWHDGVPVTGGDVVATWRYLRRSPTWCDRRPFPGFETIRDVTANGLDVTVSLREPFGAGPEAFFPYVLPAHLLKGAAGSPNAALWSAPVGSGPFKLTRREAGLWQLSKHAGTPGGTPGLATIHVRFASGAEGLKAFESLGGEGIWSWVDESQVPTLTRDAVGNLSSIRTGRWFGLAFNVQDSLLADSRLRRAIMQSYPVKKLRAEVFQEPPGGFVAPVFSRIGTVAVPVPSEDASAAARSILAMGWRPAGKDEPYRRGRQRLAAEWGHTMRESVDELTREEVLGASDAWIAVGFLADRGFSRPFFYSAWASRGYLAMPLYRMAEGVFAGPPDAGWGSTFGPGDIPGPGDNFGENIFRSEDARLRTLFTQARTEYDRAERARLSAAIVHRIGEMGLVMPVRPEVRSCAMVGAVAGFAPSAYPAGDFWNVGRWRVTKTQGTAP